MTVETTPAQEIAEALFRPRSIVLIGASDDPTKIGGRILAHLTDGGYPGEVHVVSRTGRPVQGRPSVTSVAELPTGIDLAVVATPAAHVPSTVAALGRHGVRVAVVVSSGFGETGTPQGRSLEAELRAACRETGIRVVGPNCQGVANLGARMVASFSSTFSRSTGLTDGSVAVLSQSGAMGAVLAQLAQPFVDGVRYWAATGNETDLTVADLLRGVVADPDVRTVQIYLEHLGNTAVLAEAAAEAARAGKTVLALKAGRTASGSRAAGSHTGALAQEDAVVDAFLARHGIVRARDPREMSELVRLFARPRPVGEGRVALVTNSGGLGVLLADEAEAHGLQLARFSERTLAQLRAGLPAFAAVQNPVDITAQLLTRPELVRNALAALEQDPGTDVVVVALGILGEYYDLDQILADVVDFQRRTTKLVMVCWVAGQRGMVERFAAHGVPAFDDTTACIRALAGLVRHERWTPPPAAEPVPAVQPPGAGRQSEHQGKQILTGWGLPVVRSLLAADPEEAVARAREIGYPVVLKLSAPSVAHKTELGLVEVGIADDDALRAAARRMLAAPVVGEIDGLLVEPMIAAVVEAAVGVLHDPAAGPVIMVGAGGVHAELLKDVRLLVPPIDETAARAAIESLALFPLLDGYRGRPPGDVDALVRLVVDLAAVPAVRAGQVTELDLNPVLVLPRGQGVVAVDVALTLRDESASRTTSL
ncbi:Acyl-CoA synthetase (NDP forming) [Pseudonocardia thermophila]|jgi:Acyl-CoA synthetase (NDP forming)|uniref:Acyl-CoA synthetase (NDP forming) n=1 Tax=Pseudonocardia thermophila TaxID=1848 RepID=A0A1M6Q440_PSETH|nr:acetate--CoA ligase family protein [Pseudonocardia thermophila]SHK14999.1 Acyl-CoA synthetase (NDP forming) [Pseudonocardia thermophila]